MAEDATPGREGDVLARVREQVERARRAGRAAAITCARAEETCEHARALRANLERLRMRAGGSSPDDSTAT